MQIFWAKTAYFFVKYVDFNVIYLKTYWFVLLLKESRWKEDTRNFFWCVWTSKWTLIWFVASLVENFAYVVGYSPKISQMITDIINRGSWEFRAIRRPRSVAKFEKKGDFESTDHYHINIQVCEKRCSLCSTTIRMPLSYYATSTINTINSQTTN